MARTVSLCMVGAGRVGKLQTGNIRRFLPQGRVAALVDASPEMLQETGDEFGVQDRFTSLEEAIAKVEFDAVVITTPTPTHRSLAGLAADYGKHVFLEKPMALNLAECDQIIDVCKRNGVHLQLGFMRRFDPDFVQAFERVQAGEIGEPMMVKSLTHGPGLPPPWARDLRTSNGNLAEVNSHDLDCVMWMMSSPIERIYLEVANFKGRERGVEAEHFYDNMVANIKLESGGLASITGVCPCDYGYDARVEIIGKRGIMIVGELKGQTVTVCVDREQGLVTPIFRRWPDRFFLGYIYELEHFIECMQTDSSPRVGGAEGRMAVAAVLAGTRSFLEERPVRLAEVMG